MKELLTVYVEFSQPLLIKELEMEADTLAIGDNIFSLLDDHLFFF